MTTQTLSARAALVREYKAPLSVETVQIEAPRADEVRVRMVGVGICHTDIVFRDGDGFALPTPCVLGHEGAGVVESVGDDVTTLVPGDHVVLAFLSCGSCVSCDRDQPAYCVNIGPLNYSGGRIPDGSSPLSQDGERINAAFFSQSSFATYAIAKARNAVKVAKDAPLEILGPLACGFLTGAGGVLISIGVKPGDSLAVFGGGAVGLSGMLAALAVGAETVIVVEPNAERAALAKALGATHVVDPSKTPDVAAEVVRLSGGGVTHALDATGIPSVVAAAANVLLPLGVLGTAGIPPMEASLPINMLAIMSRGISIRGICEGDADPQIFIPQMIDMYREGRFPFDRLIAKFPFDQINEAIEASKGGAFVKSVLTF